MLVGHAEPAAAFRAAVHAGSLHHAWLLAGPRGIGKATFAQSAATWLLARAAGPPAGIADDDSLSVDPDHPTARLIAAASHIDFRRVEVQLNPKTGKLRPGIAVDQLVKRDTTIGEPLNPVFQRTPALSDWRVVIVDALDDMNRNAANAFLKNLEEPPSNTLFLCISHAPGRLLPTIRSRCRTLRFGPLTDDDVAIVIAHARPASTADERATLVGVAGGAPGRALRFADVGIAELSAALARLASAHHNDAAARALTLAKALAAKAAASRYEAFLELVPAFLADHAARREGPALARALELWERATALAASAVPLSLEPQAVTFELATLVAGLADQRVAGVGTS